MGIFYHGRTVDSILIVALRSTAAEQSKGTTQTEAAVHQFLDYCATHPNEKQNYHASDMILEIHSDASYLSELKPRRRAGGPFFIRSQNFKNTRETNGTVHTVSNIIKNEMGPAAEIQKLKPFYKMVSEQNLSVPPCIKWDTPNHQHQ